MAPADDPTGTFGGAADDEVSPGASPRPTPPSAKRRRVEDEARKTAVFAPELPDEILHLIFSRVALEPRGGMPAVLAARATCRSWRRAASRQALWQNIALKRWGFCEDLSSDETSMNVDKNFELCLRLANAPEAPVWYQRGRWHRAVAACKTFRVAFCDINEMRNDTCRRVETRTRRANRRAFGDTTAPAYVTGEKPDKSMGNYSDSPRSVRTNARESRLEPPFWRRANDTNDDDVRSSFDETRRDVFSLPDDVCDADDVDRTAWHVARVSADEPNAVVLTDHLVIVHVRDVPWKRLARNLTCGLACVAVDAEVTDDEDDGDEFEKPMEATESRDVEEKEKKNRTRWVRLCLVWARVGVTLTRCGPTLSDARLFLDGYARFSHAAPSRYSRELFGDGDDYKRNFARGYHPPRRPRGFSADFQLTELESLRAAYRAIDASSFPPHEPDADSTIGVQTASDRDGHPRRPSRDVPGRPPTGLTADDQLLRYIVPLEVANDARLAENDAREDVDAAAYASSALTALASEFVCAVSFTSDEELDAMRYDQREHVSPVVTFAPAVVAATLAVPRTFHGSPLATFRVGDGAAAEVARVLERKRMSAPLKGLKCHLSFTHKNGVGYVYATALRADAAPIESTGRARGASRSPRAVHFSERHRHDAPHGTGNVFSASELTHDSALDGTAEDPTNEEELPASIDDSFADFERRAKRWDGGPDNWTVTADVYPGAHGHAVPPLSNFANEPGPGQGQGQGTPVIPVMTILPLRHVNWTREPRDDARLRGFFTSNGFDTTPDIDRVETPRMIQMHECSVSVGHSLLITAPISALVAASGRAAPRKTAREMETR